MSKSTCHSRLSSTATTPDLDINNIQLQNLKERMELFVKRVIKYYRDDNQ